MNFTPICPQLATDTLTETPLVFIVDGDAAMRERLESLVRTAGWEVRSAGSAQEFLARQRTAGLCCLLVEQHLPCSSGLDLQEVVSHQTEMPVLLMSRQADAASVVRAMKAGAVDFLTKPIKDEALLCAIDQAIARSRASLSAEAERRELKERYDSLSRREREVMDGVVSGRLNKQVGGDLGISEITVKAHRGSAMRKMGARSFAELVRMALSLRRSIPSRWTDRPFPTHAAAGRSVPQGSPVSLPV